jgi:N-acetyl-alpha-D-glucosaminyl L-malate synthase BshA
MNIGIVCYPTFGGSGVVATELGKILASKGHSVHFISYDQPARLDYFSKNLFYHEVTVSTYPLFQYPPYELALTGKIVEVVQSAKLDVLHVHYAIPHAAAAIMAKKILRDINGINIPVITTLHGTDITLVGKDPNYEGVVSYSLNQSDAVTSVSESLRTDTYKYFKINKPIQVIPNFIDLNKYQRTVNPTYRNEFADENEYILMHTSNFRKVKRINDVITIFNNVSKTKPAKLILVGDGPERRAMEQMCFNLNISDKVMFLGKQDFIEKLLSIADVFLMPSETESFGLAALEAMACSVPVICTNTGGMPELNKHGYSGFISDVGDTDAMTHFTLEILQSEKSLMQFRENALLHAHQFGTENIVPLYENLYTSLLSESL